MEAGALAATWLRLMFAWYSVVGVPPTVAGPTVVTVPPYWASRLRNLVGSPSAPPDRAPAPAPLPVAAAAVIGSSSQVFPPVREASCGTFT